MTATANKNSLSLLEQSSAGKKKFRPSILLRYFSYAAVGITVFSLVSVVLFIAVRGASNISWHFLTGVNTHNAPTITEPIKNTLIIIGCSLLITVPIGVLCAVYLCEYAKRGNKIVKIIVLAAETLAGIPSIVYAIFGVVFFVYFLGWGESLRAGIATISIMILPLLIRSAEEAIKAVPDTYREASYGLGAGKLRTVFKIVIPAAMNGILAGIVLSIGRIVGESAALIFTAGTTLLRLDGGLSKEGATLAVAMYNFTNTFDKRDYAYSTGLVLLVIVLCLNILSAFIGRRMQGATDEN